VGKKTKIDWADSTWNPVTGCLHNCDYCYARNIANRFSATSDWHVYPAPLVLDEPYRNCGEGRAEPYPHGFAPTFHRYRLGDPARWKKPRTIFVCSMADLFGKWVPDEWIKEVINACLEAPQHRYLFLTKNPARYMHLIANGIIPEDQPNFWLGSTATIPEVEFFWHDTVNTFVSIEPILAPFHDLTDEGIEPASKTGWVIIGAETGSRANKVIPKKEWIDEIAGVAKKAGTPVFMKESLRELMGDDFIQQFPWGPFDLILSPADESGLAYADNPTV